MFNYFDSALTTLSNKYGLDGIKDVILHRDDKLICYAQLQDDNNLVMNIISGSFSQIGYEDVPHLPMSQLFDDMDLDNTFAKVGGRKEYYDAVVQEILDFNTESNTTFPIKPNEDRIWIRVVTDCIDHNQRLLAIHITIVTKYIINEEELFHKTHHDSLTGVFNKYTFDYHYGRRYLNESFHVMFLDLDDFKVINDVLGHQIGDKYLQEFAGILTSHEDDYSRFYRLGGDEFVGLLFFDEDTMKSIAEDIILKTRQLSYGVADVSTSVSIGIIRATKREDVVRKADRLMYQAKELGKNRYLYQMEE